jgi:hypothetical protein
MTLTVRTFALPSISRYATTYNCPIQAILDGRYLGNPPANVSHSDRVHWQQQCVPRAFISSHVPLDFAHFCSPGELCRTAPSPHAEDGAAIWHRPLGVKMSERLTLTSRELCQIAVLPPDGGENSDLPPSLRALASPKGSTADRYEVCFDPKRGRYADLGLMHRVTFSDFLQADPWSLGQDSTAGRGSVDWAAVEANWGEFMGSSGKTRDTPFGLKSTRATTIQLPAIHYPGPPARQDVFLPFGPRFP